MHHPTRKEGPRHRHSHPPQADVGAGMSGELRDGGKKVRGCSNVRVKPDVNRDPELTGDEDDGCQGRGDGKSRRRRALQ